MNQLVECIPNFSEGRKTEVLQSLSSVIRGVPGVVLLDHVSDANHNRAVFTFVGHPQGVEEAAFLAAREASRLIDMREHKGEHPRMGAVDVIPFVPVKDVSMAECVELSRRLGERISRELGIPVFLYEESSTRPGRKNLADIRRGEFEGMPEKLKDPNWKPDYGDAVIHPTAGVAAVGARAPLVAYNINLNTDNLAIAKEIAKIIRESSGGLKFVKAIGVMLEDRKLAQVSINMTSYEKTPLYRVFELVKTEARRYGVDVVSSEIVGLTPMNALIECAMYYLQLENYDPRKQVLENHLL